MTPIEMASRDEVTLTAPWLHLRPYHGEGVVWDSRRRMLMFVDVNAGRVWQFEVTTGRIQYFELPGTVCAVHPVADDRSVVVADSDGIALCRDGRIVKRLAAPLAAHPEIRMNAANVDPGGRYFAGSMAFDKRPGAARLYRLDSDASLTIAVDNVTISNGIDWSPDGTLCYYVDSPLRRVDVFDYDVTTGTLSNRRPFVDVSDVPGMPDGLTVDASGGVWVAFFGGARVCRFSADATMTTTVRLPVKLVTSCCFGGPDLEDLFISTSAEDMPASAVAREPAAGAVFTIRTAWHGRPVTPFQVA